MARLQILELPDGPDDVRPPFVLVVDESEPERVILGMDHAAAYSDRWTVLAERIGARGVVVTPETVAIPANDLLSAESFELRDAGDDEAGRRERQLEMKLKAFAEAQHGRDVHLMDQVTDALGFDRLRDWDEITAAIRAQRKTEAEGGHRFGEPGFCDPLRCAQCRISHTDWVLRGTRCESVRAANGGE